MRTLNTVILPLFLFLALPLVCQGGVPGFMRERMGTLSGQAVDEAGKPLAGGGVVSFFNTEKGIPPLIANMHRIPDMVGRMEADGKFSINLLPGSYYMGILMITDPKRGPGPPRSGETFYFVKDDNGGLRKFALGMKEVQDAGRVVGAVPGSFPAAKNLVTIEGRLLREDGSPFADGTVLVKTDMNSARPDFVSERTDKDGRFKLQLPADTPYYLLGRERAVGRPVPGTYIGTYGSTSAISEGGALPIGNVRPAGPASGMPQGDLLEPGAGDNLPATVSGKAGETISGIDIMMFKMPVPEEQREKLQGTLGFGDQNKPAEGAPAKPPEPATAPAK